MQRAGLQDHDDLLNEEGQRDDEGSGWHRGFVSALGEWKAHLLLQRAGKQTEQAPRVMELRQM